MVVTDKEFEEFRKAARAAVGMALVAGALFGALLVFFLQWVF